MSSWRSTADDAGLGLGEGTFVVNAQDLAPRFERVKRAAGASVASEPEPIEYSAPVGEGTIAVLLSVLYDLDGYCVEVDKLLGEAVAHR